MANPNPSPVAFLRERSTVSPLSQILYASLLEKEREIVRLRGQATAREHLVVKLQARQAELQAFQSGAIWYLVQILRRCRLALVPSGTRRERCLRLFRRALRVARREGTRALLSKATRQCLPRTPQTKSGPDRMDVSLPSGTAQPLPTLPLSCPALSVVDSAIFQEILALPRRQTVSSGQVIDVIVPVYKGLNETLRCLRSVLAAQQVAAHELIVINDTSPDATLFYCLSNLADRGLITLLNNPSNLGFVKTANRGLALHSDRDVVLLNSDTEVYGDWLDRLRTAAYSATNVGTVTPLSNNATICSYPFVCEDNNLPDGLTADQLDRLCADWNEGGYVEVPTGVGFCMYFRRDCLEVINLLDEEHFGKGYGEENDFCVRATRRGWRHLLTTDTFVYHRGGTSFGASKNPAMERAMKVLEALHPEYLDSIVEHGFVNPALPFRRRLDLARVAGPQPAMLYITHNRGGGTERHVVDLAKRLEQEGRRAIILRPLDAHRVSLERVTVKHTPNLVFTLPDERWTLVATLYDLGVDHIHVHHTIDIPKEVLQLIGDLGLSYDWTIHDYYAICPRINLINETGIYCGEPSVAQCESCLKKNGAYNGEQLDILRWREEYGGWLAGARKVFVPHRDVAVRLARYFPHIEFHERRHFESHPRSRVVAAPFVAGEPLRVAIIGSLAPHKGLNIVRQCAQDGLARKLPILFYVVGNVEGEGTLQNMPNVHITGRYNEEEIFDLLQSLHCHCAFFPSVWPETYTYTLSIALLGGLPPFAFDLGAPAARIRECKFGHLIPLTQDGVAINDRLLAQSRQLGVPHADHPWTPTVYPNLVNDYYGLAESVPYKIQNVA